MSIDFMRNSYLRLQLLRLVYISETGLQLRRLTYVQNLVKNTRKHRLNPTKIVWQRRFRCSILFCTLLFIVHACSPSYTDEE